MDKLTRTATKIERTMLDGIDEAYHDVLKPVLRKHKQTLAKLDKLMAAGDSSKAHALWRRSGIVDDLAKAVAAAGRTSAGIIRAGLKEIREAAHDTG